MSETESTTYQEILARIRMLQEASGERPPLIDPTANVLSLVAAAIKRQDDLREQSLLYENALRRADGRRLDEQSLLREEYGKQLRDAESKRIDAIRAVDVAAVATANERAIQQASVLANQVAGSAETLRSLVASTAEQVAKNLSNVSTQLTDRLALLEKSQYQIGGRDVQREVAKVDISRYVGWGVAIAIALGSLLLRGKLG